MQEKEKLTLKSIFPTPPKIRRLENYIKTQFL
jgi:hypothetical protein